MHPILLQYLIISLIYIVTTMVVLKLKVKQKTLQVYVNFYVAQKTKFEGLQTE